jgi:hypothetical protein
VVPSRRRRKILVYSKEVVLNWPSTVNSITHRETEGRTEIEVPLFGIYITE